MHQVYSTQNADGSAGKCDTCGEETDRIHYLWDRDIKLCSECYDKVK